MVPCSSSAPAAMLSVQSSTDVGNICIAKIAQYHVLTQRSTKDPLLSLNSKLIKKNKLLTRKYECEYTHIWMYTFSKRTARSLHFAVDASILLICLQLQNLLQRTLTIKNKFHFTETEIQSFSNPAKWQSTCPMLGRPK